ncbi:hypothetical protein [Nannocystis punicea]|uniref:Uncharacterized protein n=1 Tax=Nannocystis punicea TaxID=2995304 RepID=A0ABY7H4Y7_9BACT|nr:hypothetical protein [Nannocystis poenicansa]WAS94348.1 hypothetical protein O0S08_50145 [Nannocystis poenicansa]
MDRESESPHPLGDVDVHCTVVSRASFAELMRSVHERASAVGWPISSLAVHDEEDEPIVGDLAGRTRTRGRFDYGPQARRVFWICEPRGTCCQFFGGVFIREFAEAGEDLALACARAMDDMMVLFGGPETLCVVLGWEDDPAIDVGPGLVGVYRRTLGVEVGVADLAVTVRGRDSAWIEVRTEPSERGRQAALTIQAAIAGALIHECGCDCAEA